MKAYGSSVMRRDVCAQLMDEADDLCRKGVDKLIVRGTPGTGTSWWLHLVMREGARRGVKIVWQHSVFKRRFMFNGHTVLEGNNQHFIRELQGPNVWYLVDGEAPDLVFARTFLVVDLEHKLYHKYRNAAGNGAAVRLMPPWTLKELLRARQLVFPSLHKDRVTELFTMWGGTPRYCLLSVEREMMQRELYSAVDNIGLEELFSGVRCLETADSRIHRILHWSVSPDLKQHMTVFASKYVVRKIMRRLHAFYGAELMEVRQFHKIAAVRPLLTIGSNVCDATIRSISMTICTSRWSLFNPMIDACLLSV